MIVLLSNHLVQRCQGAHARCEGDSFPCGFFHIIKQIIFHPIFLSAIYLITFLAGIPQLISDSPQLCSMESAEGYSSISSRTVTNVYPFTFYDPPQRFHRRAVAVMHENNAAILHIPEAPRCRSTRCSGSPSRGNHIPEYRDHRHYKVQPLSPFPERRTDIDGIFPVIS